MTQESSPEKSDRELLEEMSQRLELAEAVLTDVRDLLSKVKRHPLARNFLGLKE